MLNHPNNLSKTLTVRNEFGLHARPAARIAQIAKNAKSKVWLIKDEEAVDASSIIDLLSMACGKGSEITLRVEDFSDLEILNAIAALVEDGFGE